LPRLVGVKCILVVEADASIGEVITDALETAAFAVQIVATATAALEALGHQPPDAILVDLAEPGEEGWVFLVRCRKQRGCTKLPIAIMSTTLAEAAAAGMAGERGYALLAVMHALTIPAAGTSTKPPEIAPAGP
jgi:DNA-binding response OmpR family regulator